MSVAAPEFLIGRKQQELHDAVFSGKYKIVCVSSGRQAGKTYAGAYVGATWLTQGEPDSIYWVVAPLKRLTKAAFRRIRFVLRSMGVPESDLRVVQSSDEMILEYKPLRTEVHFFSARNQGTLVGETLSGVHIDEAGKILDKLVLYEDIIPACAVKSAPILITGTPKAASKWYRQIFFSGLADSPQYGKSAFSVLSLFMDARDNPVGGAIVEEFHRYEQATKEGTYPEDTWRQEWLGQWVDSGGQVFRNLDEAVMLGKVLERKNWEDVEHRNILQVDIGTSADYAAVAVFADRYIYNTDTGLKNLVVKAVEQIPHMDYVRLSRRLFAIAEEYGDKYPARCVLDGTGLPPATRRTLGSSGLRIHWHIWDQKNRAAAIAQTQALLDTKRLALPDNDELMEELAGFQERETKNGRIRIEAGPNLHDDMTMAVVQGCYLLSSRMKPMRFRSDKWAEEAKVRKRSERSESEDPVDPVDRSFRPSASPVGRLKKMPRRRGRTTGWF